MTLAEGQSQQAQFQAVVQGREGMRQSNGRKTARGNGRSDDVVFAETPDITPRTCQAGMVAFEE